MSTEDLAERLHSVALHLLRRLRQEDAASGIGPARLSALSVLVFVGPRSLGQLAQAEQVTPATISRVARGLVEQGLASRRRDATDRRVHRLHATAAGARLLEAARQRRVRALELWLQPLNARQREALQRAVFILEGMPSGQQQRAGSRPPRA
jgi:DNA-binding MarR family transcriptional regulator